ncbi:MAG: hypothetical protein AAB582_02165 [Patescibacteria group bacterium]
MEGPRQSPNKQRRLQKLAERAASYETESDPVVETVAAVESETEDVPEVDSGPTPSEEKKPRVRKEKLQKGVLNASAERSALAGIQAERIAAGADPALYDQLVETLDAYELITDEVERKILAETYPKMKEAFLTTSIPAAPQTDPDEKSARKRPRRGQDLLSAEQGLVNKTKEQARQQYLAFAKEIRRRGIEPNMDIPTQWKPVYRAYNGMRRALTAYNESDQTDSDGDQDLIDQYYDHLEAFNAASSVARAAVDRILTERSAEAEARALAPLPEALAAYGDIDTTAGERRSMKEPLKKSLEEVFEYDESSAFLGVEDSDGEEVTPTAAPSMSPGKQQAAEASESPASEEPERVTPFDHEGTPAEAIDADFEHISPPPNPMDLSDGKPIVMLNSVLDRQAMGGRKPKTPRIYPGMITPAGVTPATVIERQEKKEKQERQKKFWSRVLPPALVGIAAALFLANNKGDTTKSTESVKKGERTPAASMQPGAAVTSPDLSSVIVPAGTLTERMAASLPDWAGVDMSARSETSTPPSEAVEEVASAQAVEAPAERVTVAPKVRRHPSVTPDQFRKWNITFNLWMHAHYPKGYVASEAEKVRKEMVKELNYPYGTRKIVKVPQAASSRPVSPQAEVAPQQTTPTPLSEDGETRTTFTVTDSNQALSQEDVTKAMREAIERGP